MLHHNVWSWLRIVTTHPLTLTGLQCDRRPVCSECTLTWKQPQISATIAGSVLRSPPGRHDGWTLERSASPRSLKVDAQHQWACLTYWHGFQDIWLANFLFSFMSEKEKKTYAQLCKCDWICCNNTLDATDLPWEAYVNKTASSVKVFVLPDILMFIMRVYYHDDNLCAILVYCCLNVILFFYDMLR